MEPERKQRMQINTALALVTVLKEAPAAKAIRGALVDIGRVLEGEGEYFSGTKPALAVVRTPPSVEFPKRLPERPGVPRGIVKREFLRERAVRYYFKTLTAHQEDWIEEKVLDHDLGNQDVIDLLDLLNAVWDAAVSETGCKS